ncbi:Firmicu-CTERM sorting domain-containing protein [Lapidilactobacillus luobeiensis]|uniref:Firmicu-CTERM sorting domain-containing protein n=1 Tax=Lapidilactobacillus luobeiensis TaxID=2950371 RepID=UPI0021C2E911|nr:Firmicu-CTERM sorting domain-containing protein [Lapidilactobacillus luobeiensis]
MKTFRKIGVGSRALLGILLVSLALLAQATVTARASTVTSPITIDGRVDDWGAHSQGELSYTNGHSNVRHIGLFSDGTYIYFYVNMNPDFQGTVSHLPSDGYHLEVEGRRYSISLKDPEFRSPFTSKVGEQHDLRVQSEGGVHYANSQATVLRLGDGQGHSSEQVEVKIKVTDLNAGLKLNPSAPISFENNTAIGEEKVTYQGTSSGPVLLAGIGFVIALLGIYQVRPNHHQKRLS